MGSMQGGFLLIAFFVWLGVVGYLLILATRLVRGVERIAAALDRDTAEHPAAGFGETDRG